MPKRKSGPNSELMIRAASEGGRLAQQGQEAVLRAKEQSAQEISDVGKQLVTMGERQHDREHQSSESEKERAFRSNENLKERVAHSGDQARELRSREKIEADRLSLEAADRGLEEVPQEQAGGAPPGGAMDPRMQKTKEAMDRGREQNAKRIEMTTQGPKKFRPDEARQEKERSDAETKRFNAETARANAFNAERRRVDQYNEAQQRQDKEALARVRKDMQAPMEADQRLYNALGKGELSKNDPKWQMLEDEFINNPLTGEHPSQEVVDEIRNRAQFAPNLQRLISNRQAVAGIKMAGDTGDLPDNALLDTGNPLWQRFFDHVEQAKQFLGGSAISAFVDIRDVEHRKRMCHQAAALIMQLEPIYGATAPAAMLGASMMPGPARMAAQAGLQQQAGQGLQQLGRGANEQPAGPQQPAAPRVQPVPPQPRRQPTVGEQVEQRGFAGGGPR